MRKLLFTFYVTLFFFSSTAAAQPCGWTCLSKTDHLAATSAQDSVVNWAKIMASSGGSSDVSQVFFKMKRLTSASKDVIDDMREARRSTTNAGLRRFYGRVINIASEVGDIATVGAALMEAHLQNRSSISSGLADAIASADVKKLAAPVGSTLELQARIKSFTSIAFQRIPQIEANLMEALKELKATENIDF